MLTARLCLVALAARVALAQDWNPEYYKEEWTGQCAAGQLQSPIDLVFSDATKLPRNMRTNFQMPVVQDVRLNNVGTTLKLEWTDLDYDNLPEVVVAGDGIADVIANPGLEPKRTVKVKPAQMHFHVSSEHIIEGLYFAAEAHIVTFIAPGEAPEWGCDEVWNGGDPVLDRCTAVFGTLFRLSDTTTQWLYDMHEQAPNTVGASVPWSGSSFDLNKVIPDDKSYFTYTGSLTTPPCAEGLRWHVFRKPLDIDIATQDLIMTWLSNVVDQEGNEAVARTNNRLPQPLNSRDLYWSRATGMRPYKPSICRPPGQ